MWARRLLKLSAWHQALMVLWSAYIWNSTLQSRQWTSILKKLLCCFGFSISLQPNLIITKYEWHLDKHTLALTCYLCFIFLLICLSVSSHPLCFGPIHHTISIFKLFPSSCCRGLAAFSLALSYGLLGSAQQRLCPEPPGREYFPTK